MSTNKLTTLLFDLDGTLANLFEGIQASHACHKFHLSYPSAEPIHKMIGLSVPKKILVKKYFSSKRGQSAYHE